ncbi:MAG: KEOPS complex kinase/ATPase Bud32 [Candidatus Diapherotrites archaeon]|nr:KEOPS complex kinase/ATPase Bud32 [Candidatus Diapherotrites archaeon]
MQKKSGEKKRREEKKFRKIGAEAVLTEKIFMGKKAVSKRRLKKKYRNGALDSAIRKKRTRAEAKLIRAGAPIVRVPSIFNVDEADAEILMEFIEGKRLKEVVEKRGSLCTLAGKEIRKLHDCGIIHGDLTTSNIIVVAGAKGGKNGLCLVDFGLGFFSNKIEDKATDLIVFKKTFNATHSGLRDGWALVMKGYAPNEEMNSKMNAIEKRARYH